MSQATRAAPTGGSKLATWVHAFNAKVLLSNIQFDYDCSCGQVRPLSESLVQMKKEDFELNPPTGAPQGDPAVAQRPDVQDHDGAGGSALSCRPEDDAEGARGGQEVHP